MFLTANRVYRVIAQRLNPLPNPDAVADPMSAGARAAGRIARSPARCSARPGRSSGGIRGRSTNQCTGKQLIDGLRRVEARYGHPEVPLPFVLIGHSKTFTSHNERSLRPFLEFVAEHPDRFSFGTFADFNAERYRMPVAA